MWGKKRGPAANEFKDDQAFREQSTSRRLLGKIGLNSEVTKCNLVQNLRGVMPTDDIDVTKTKFSGGVPTVLTTYGGDIFNVIEGPIIKIKKGGSKKDIETYYLIQDNDKDEFQALVKYDKNTNTWIYVKDKYGNDIGFFRQIEMDHKIGGIRYQPIIGDNWITADDLRKK